MRKVLTRVCTHTRRDKSNKSNKAKTVAVRLPFVQPRRKIQIGGIFASHASGKRNSAAFLAPRAPLPFAQARPLLEIEKAFFDRVSVCLSETFPSLNCAWREQASATADGKRGEDRAPLAFSKRVTNSNCAFFFKNELSRFFGRCAQVVPEL